MTRPELCRTVTDPRSPTGEKMQTFLPHPTLEGSVKCLDFHRLNSQINEAHIILNVLLGRSKKDGTPTTGWQHHPVVKMWRGYEAALALYHNLALAEFIRRGGENKGRQFEEVPDNVEMPPWLGNESFHAGHRSQLLAKARERLRQGFLDQHNWYDQFCWREAPGKFPYIWPTTQRSQLVLVPLDPPPPARVRSHKTVWEPRPMTVGVPDDHGTVNATITAEVPVKSIVPDGDYSLDLVPHFNATEGTLFFGHRKLRSFRTPADPYHAPPGTVDVTRRYDGVWCWVVQVD